LLSRARIAFAQSNWQQGKEHAINAYQQAQVDHYKKDTLDAALLLLQHQKQEIPSLVSNEFYDFIQRNATPRWLSQNSQALEEFNKDSN
jgi:hypothetical protein